MPALTAAEKTELAAAAKTVARLSNKLQRQPEKPVPAQAAKRTAAIKKSAAIKKNVASKKGGAKK